MNERRRVGRVRKRLLIAALVLAVLVLVAIVVTGVIPVGIVTLHLDQETYRPNEIVTITLTNVRTGSVYFGRPFAVQRFEEGDWVGVPLDILFTHELRVLHLGQAFQQSFVPARDFFETPMPGRYRVVKEVQVGSIYHRAKRESLTLIAEFRIR